MVVTKFSARVATIKISSTAVVFDTSTLLSAESYSTGTINEAKNITVAMPKSELEIIPLLGETAQSIGAGIPVANTAQNAVIDEKNQTNAVVTGTVVLDGDEIFEAMVAGSGTATGSATATRYAAGDSASGKTRVKVGALLIDLDNGSEQVTVVLSNALFNLGEVKPTGADGHFEQDFEATCLPEHFALEYKT